MKVYTNWLMVFVMALFASMALTGCAEFFESYEVGPAAVAGGTY